MHNFMQVYNNHLQVEKVRVKEWQNYVKIYKIVDAIIEKEKASLQHVTLEELLAILNRTQEATTVVKQMQA